MGSIVHIQEVTVAITPGRRADYFLCVLYEKAGRFRRVLLAVVSWSYRRAWERRTHAGNRVPPTAVLIGSLGSAQGPRVADGAVLLV